MEGPPSYHIDPAAFWDDPYPDLKAMQAELPVAWGYPRPRARFDTIKDCIAFYPGRVECYVDGERVQPQAGGFYGGWITSEVVGPFKGERGTGHW